LIEKPLTIRSEDGKDLVNLAKKSNRRLMVGHTFIFNPAVKKIRELIKSGELGQIYYINCTRVNLGLLQPDIKVMWDLAPHDISILNYILEDDPVKVSAIGSVYINKTSKLPEVVYINLRFRNEILANLRVSWLDPVKTRRITIVGSKKMLVYDDIAEDKIVVSDKGVEVPEYSITEEEFRASYRLGPEEFIPLNWIEPLRTECQHFIDCVRGGIIPISNGENGLKVVKILESAQRSLANGGHELVIEY
jgi:predicted dehydrogenase